VVAHEDQIADVERRFGVRFPADYRGFLLTRGSMEGFISPARTYLVLHAIDEIIPMNEAGDIEARFPGGVVIGGNGAREMLTYDFRQAQPPLVLIDISAGSWSDALYQAPSLTALLAQLPGRGWSFA